MESTPPLISADPTPSQGVPVIYTRCIRPAPLSIAARGFAALIALGCLAILVVAAWLPPSPSGYGTHRQLGLSACAFLARTGLPCPSCGYTTAFSYFAHGNPLVSFYTQPMGALLALSSAVAFWAGLYIAITGRPVHRLLKLLPSRYYLMPLLSFGLLAWGWKILITLRAARS